jgi:cytidylate kinase
MAVITLSRQLGAHGEEIATQVAQALGQRLVDAETINQAALEAGVPQVALAELQREGERGLANQMLKALRTMPSLRTATPPGATDIAEAEKASRTMPFVGLFSPTAPPISASLESYVRMVSMVIRELAREGNVLVVGRGGQVLLQKHPCALHVQIVAPQTERVEEVSERLGLTKQAARRRVRASDRIRADYLRRYHDRDWLEPTLYHLVLNTGRVPVATAVDLIIAAQQAVVNLPERDSAEE